MRKTQPDRPRRTPIEERSVPPTLPDGGLLVGWSLEHEYRRPVVGFAPQPANPPTEPSLLEPILATGEGHLLTIAPTGSGKGVSCIIPALLRHQGPLVVIDPKGEAYAVTARRRREMGDEVVVLDPFHVTEASEAASLNPLDIIDIESPLAIDDADMLARMIASHTSKTDPFWDERARQLIGALIMHLVSDNPPILRNLGEVHYLLNQSSTHLDLTAKRMADSPRPEVKSRAAILNTAEARVRASIVSTAQAHVELLGSPSVKAAMAQTSFRLDDLTRGAPLSIYIVLPPDKLESHGKILRLWLGVIFSCLSRRRRAPGKPTLLILDEAAQLGELPQLRQAVTLLRGYGVRTWSFWQDISQLENLYPVDWRTIVNNCRVVQAFGMANLAAAETIRAISGFRTAIEILDLDADEMLLLAAGDEAVIAQRPNYLTDPPFAGLYDQNPFHKPADIMDILPRRPQRTFNRASVSRVPPDAAQRPVLNALWSVNAMLTLRHVGEFRRAGKVARSLAAEARLARQLSELPASELEDLLEDVCFLLVDGLVREDFMQARAAAIGLGCLWPRAREFSAVNGEAGLDRWKTVTRRAGLEDVPEAARQALASHLRSEQVKQLGGAAGWTLHEKAGNSSDVTTDKGSSPLSEAFAGELYNALALPGRHRSEGLDREAAAAERALIAILSALTRDQVAPILRMIASRLRFDLAIGDRYAAWSQALGLVIMWKRPAEMVMNDGSTSGILGWREIMKEVGLAWSESSPMRQLLKDLGTENASLFCAALGVPEKASSENA